MIEELAPKPSLYSDDDTDSDEELAPKPSLYSDDDTDSDEMYLLQLYEKLYVGSLFAFYFFIIFLLMLMFTNRYGDLSEVRNENTPGCERTTIERVAWTFAFGRQIDVNKRFCWIDLGM